MLFCALSRSSWPASSYSRFYSKVKVRLGFKRRQDDANTSPNFDEGHAIDATRQYDDIQAVSSREISASEPVSFSDA